MKKSISTSDIFVKKVSEKSDTVISKNELSRIWVLSGGSKSRLAYGMSILLGRAIILSIARDLYYIKKPRPSLRVESIPTFPATKTISLSSNNYLDELYWTIVRKLISLHAPGWAIIGGEKSLELHLKNYEIPDILIIYTRNTASRIRLSNGREIHFRTLSSGAKSGKKNLYTTLLKYSIILSDPEELQILSLEASLLDSLALHRHEEGIEEWVVLRFLRQHARELDRTILWDLTRLRYIRPMNRLRRITRDNGYAELYTITLDIIKNEWWGCFLNI